MSKRLRLAGRVASVLRQKINAKTSWVVGRIAKNNNQIDSVLAGCE
jgi:hypothetical protein